MTRARFRQMQRSFDPKSFDVWERKLTLLKPGMEREQVYRTLGLDEQNSAHVDPVAENGMWFDNIQLNDAYYTTALFYTGGQKAISQWVTSPCAVRYHVQSAGITP